MKRTITITAIAVLLTYAGLNLAKTAAASPKIQPAAALVPATAPSWQPLPNARSSQEQPRAAVTVTGSQPWILLRCKFAGVPDEPAEDHQEILDHADDYFRQVSYDAMNIAGSAVITPWYTLPYTIGHYLDGGAINDAGVQDCASVADPDVDNFSDYSGIAMVFNDAFTPSGGGAIITVDGGTANWDVVLMPPYYGLAVWEHEMGHALGLAHPYGNGVYINDPWTPMGSPRCWPGAVSIDPFGCHAQHYLAASKNLLGWVPGERIKSIPPGGSDTFTLEQLAQLPASNYLLAKIPIDGSDSHYYTLEARRQTDYDANLPGEGVIIHDIQEQRWGDVTVGIRSDVIGAPSDDDYFTHWSNTAWTPGRTYVDAANGITVTVVSSTTTGWVVSVQNGPPTAVNAPSSVVIGGPTTGVTAVGYAFSATVSPLTATLPISYVWQAAGAQTVTHTGGLSDTVTFTWTQAGDQAITVTATNAGGAASGMHTIVIAQQPAHRVFLPVVLR